MIRTHPHVLMPRVVCFGFLLFCLLFPLGELRAQTSSHPHLFFDRAGMEALRQRVLTNPRLEKIWRRFKVERADSALRVVVQDAGFQDVTPGRAYGDALGDLAVAYVVLREQRYVEKAKEILAALAERASWGDRLITAHISLGLAFCWDVMYEHFSADERRRILEMVRAHGDNRAFPDVYANANWTASAGEGLLGLAFAGDGDPAFNRFAEDLLRQARQNFKEKARSVLWAHGSDGFPHEGLGYWRKYTHIGLFFTALRRKQPEDDWFHLGPDFPGSAFLKNTGWPRIYAQVGHVDLATLTWADATQVRGKYGNLATLTLVASEYRNGYVLDFIDYLLDEVGVDFNGEDWATFVFYRDDDVPLRSFRNLPLSRYWPDMEAAVFRSGWTNRDLVFYIRCGSPGGHARRLKRLPEGGHDHPDANGFVLFYHGDYLAAEDGRTPTVGPDAGSRKKFTLGHNTFLVDGQGQKGDGTRTARTTRANLDFVDTEHLGYVLGDASDAYEGLDKFYRYVFYKKHDYLVLLDELSDATPHRYEFLLGTDHRHRIRSAGASTFWVEPTQGSARLLVHFVEPQQVRGRVTRDRVYAVAGEFVDVLRVWPESDRRGAAFLSLLVPLKRNEAPPRYEAFQDGTVRGLVVRGNEWFLYNPEQTRYRHGPVVTDARFFYYRDDATALEYFAVGAREFLFADSVGFSADRRLVAGFKGQVGKVRLGKNLGELGTTRLTLRFPQITGVKVDGQTPALLDSSAGTRTFELTPKQYAIGPPGYEQTVTDNYDVRIATPAVTPPDPEPDVPSGPERVPEVPTLWPVYPNPFNRAVTIEYSLPMAAHVRLSVYDLLGREVYRLVDAQQSAGRRRARWDARDARGREVASGVYFVTLRSGSKALVRKVVVQR